MREGESSSSDATISCVEISGFHCKTEHLLLSEILLEITHKLFCKKKQIATDNFRYTFQNIYGKLLKDGECIKMFTLLLVSDALNPKQLKQKEKQKKSHFQGLKK